jgi:hypothetical protein
MKLFAQLMLFAHMMFSAHMAIGQKIEKNIACLFFCPILKYVNSADEHYGMTVTSNGPLSSNVQ